LAIKRLHKHCELSCQKPRPITEASRNFRFGLPAPISTLPWFEFAASVHPAASAFPRCLAIIQNGQCSPCRILRRLVAPGGFLMRDGVVTIPSSGNADSSKGPKAASSKPALSHAWFGREYIAPQGHNGRERPIQLEFREH
jgi:hypothetical protein